MVIKMCNDFINNYNLLTDYRIVILISTDCQDGNHVASRLSHYLKQIPQLPTDDEIAKYFHAHNRQPFNLEGSLSAQEKYMYYVSFY